MAAELEPTRVYSEQQFRTAFRLFHFQFTAAIDSGLSVGELLTILEDEGVELPDFIKMML